MKRRPIIITMTNSITIPKKVREMLQLQPGDCLDYEVMVNGTIILAKKECCNSPALHPSCGFAKKAQNCLQSDWLEDGNRDATILQKSGETEGQSA